MEKRILEKSDIEFILPHRGLNLLLDRVELMEDWAIGYLTYRKEFAPGHFPDYIIMKATERLEMMAQTLAIAAELPNGKVPYFVSHGKGRYPAPVEAGDLVRAEVKIKQRSHRMVLGDGKSYVGDKLVAEVEDIMGLIKI